MKKYLAASALAFAITIMALPAAGIVAVAHAQSYTFSTDLSLGARGADVVALQAWLISNGFDIPSVSSGAVVKGYFGAQTKSALVRYQASVGLAAYGYFGPLTRAKLNGNSQASNSLKVASPNGGETWVIGTTQNITWKSALVSSSAFANQTGTIKLEFPLPACAQPGQVIKCMIMVRAPYTIAAGVSLNSGSYPWNVGQIPNTTQFDLHSIDMAPEGQYKIQICTTDGSICDESDANFTISSTTSSGAGPLKITSPNGGEMWQRGSTQNITWTSPYYFAATNVDVSLISALNSQRYLIASGIPVNQNSYNWNVGTNWNLGINQCIPPAPCATTPMISDGQYTVQICTLGHDTTPGVCDSSDAPFTITTAGSNSNQAPVISGLDAPTSLIAGETGTWTIHASDPNNGPLSYSVIWGDEGTYSPTVAFSAVPQQFISATSFTHVYANAGNYTVKVTVKNSAGLTAQTSSTVRAALANDAQYVCPAGYTCTPVSPY